VNIVNAIRTLRSEQGLGYEDACVKAVDFFRKKGWRVPDYLDRKYPAKVEVAYPQHVCHRYVCHGPCACSGACKRCEICGKLMEG